MTVSIARDVTYAFEAKTKLGRNFIRGLENISGRPKLLKRVEGYAEEVEAGANFWEVMVERYGISLNVTKGAIENIPSEGPVVVVGNHPFGILDGLAFGYLLSRRRQQFKIIANHVFRRARDLDDVILPVDFGGTREALAKNMNMRKESIEWLQNDGLIGIFPAGTVATSLKPFGQPFDCGWGRMPTKLITRTNARVVPVYFSGQNSRLFQVASHIHPNFRMGLLINEFRKRVDMPVELMIGEPISRETLAPYLKDADALKKYLRKSVYDLAGIVPQMGYEFEEKYRQ